MNIQPFGGVNISGFSDEISSDFDTQLQYVADLGMEYISIRGIDGKNIGDFTVEEFEKGVLPRIKAANIKVSSIGSPVGKVFIDDVEGYEKQKDVLKRCCQISRLLDCKYIRIFSFYMPEGVDPDSQQDKVVKRLIELTKIAQEHGVILLHENEKDVYGDTVKRCQDIFETVDSPNFRAIFDFANFVQLGEDTWQGYKKLEQYIEYYHIKDAVYHDKQNVVCGTGEGKIKQILKDALAKGFKGFLTLEPHLVIFDSLKDLELEDVNEIIRDDKGLDGKGAYKLQYEALITLLNEIKEEM